MNGWTHERLAAAMDAAAPGAALLLRAALPDAAGFLAERKRVACERTLDRLLAAVDESATPRARMAIIGSMAALCMDGFLWGKASVLWSMIRAAVVMGVGRPHEIAALTLLAGVNWKRGEGEPLPMLMALGLELGATKNEREELARVVAAGNRPDIVVSSNWWEAVPATVAILVEMTADAVDRAGSHRRETAGRDGIETHQEPYVASFEPEAMPDLSDAAPPTAAPEPSVPVPERTPRRRDPEKKAADLMAAWLKDGALLGASNSMLAAATGLTSGTITNVIRAMLKQPEGSPRGRLARQHIATKAERDERAATPRRPAPDCRPASTRARSRDAADREALGDGDALGGGRTRRRP